MIRRNRGRADAYLYVTGRDIEEEAELAFRWDAETAGWRIAGDAEAYRRSKLRNAIQDVLREAGEPTTPTEVASALDKPVNTVRQRMNHMWKDGQLTNSEGRYTLNDHNPHNCPTGPGGDGYGVTLVTDRWVEGDGQ